MGKARLAAKINHTYDDYFSLESTVTTNSDGWIAMQALGSKIALELQVFSSESAERR